MSAGQAGGAPGGVFGGAPAKPVQSATTAGYGFFYAEHGVLQDESDRGRAAALRRAAGLLSLVVELPEGGIQRNFEALGGEANIELILMGQSRFLRLRFIAWMGAFLILLAVWMLSRKMYPILLFVILAVSLIAPIAARTPWVAFWNAMFQGAMFSLIIPLLALWSRRAFPKDASAANFQGPNSNFPANDAPLTGGHSSKRSSTPAAAKLFTLMALGLAFCAWAASSFAQPPSSPSAAPVAVVVPYDSNIPPAQNPNPLAWVSREGFAELWKSANPESERPNPPAAALVEILLDGELAPSNSVIQGTLHLRAANPEDRPSSLPLRLAGIRLSADAPAKISQSGAALESLPEGLILRMAPRWAGRLSVNFSLPYQAQGTEGKVRVDFPPTASGFWRIQTPYSRISAKSQTSSPWMIEHRDDRKELLAGPIRPGVMELSWSSLQDRAVEDTSDNSSATSQTAQLKITQIWNNLSVASWSGALSLEASSESLPAEIRFPIVGALRISSVEAEGLRDARVENSTLILHPEPRQRRMKATIEGFVPPPAKPLEAPAAAPAAASAHPSPALESASRWETARLLAPEHFELKSAIRFEISERLEVIALDADGLERLPSRGMRQGFSVYDYRAQRPDWSARVELRSPRLAFTAEISECFALSDGLLRQSGHAVVTPKESRLNEIVLELAPGTRIRSLSGEGVSLWTQNQSEATLSFIAPAEKPFQIEWVGISDEGTSASAARFQMTPSRLRGASSTRRLAAVFAPADWELIEEQLSGANPRPPQAEDSELLGLLGDGAAAPPQGNLRAFTLVSDEPLTFRLAPIEASALTTVYSRTTVGEGLQSLEGFITAAPRRGRIHQVEALLALAAPDPLASTRIQADPPSRRLTIENISDRLLLIRAELDAPRSEPVTVRLTLDQPVLAGEGKPISALMLAPAHAEGARSFLLLRRAFEGDLAIEPTPGLRAADPNQVKWPDSSFRALASDRMYELDPSARNGPSFRVVRHEREEALRAVVQTLRERMILTADGLERCELEIVVQNQSEQFLELSLPYPKSQIALYEIQVGSRTAQAALTDGSGGKCQLQIPLIRTGLLEPELSVRVVFTVQTGAPLAQRGSRETRLPDVLGGVPVAQSSLILMLPSSYSYKKFEGSLNRVELVDLDVDEAVRRAQMIQKLSETALYNRGDTQKAAYQRLGFFQKTVKSKVQEARQTTEAYGRAYQSRKGGVADKDVELSRERKLAVERSTKLQMAEEAEKQIFSNVQQINQMLNQQTQTGIPQQGGIPQQAMPQSQAAMPQAPPGLAPAPPSPPPSPPPPPPPPPPLQESPAEAAAPSIQFPRSGEVFVFRQLQGTGSIRFDYRAREIADSLKDWALAAVLLIAAAFVLMLGRWLFSTRRRVSQVLLVIAVCAILARVALDATIPLLGIALFLFWISPRNSQASASTSSSP